MKYSTVAKVRINTNNIILCICFYIKILKYLFLIGFAYSNRAEETAGGVAIYSAEA